MNGLYVVAGASGAIGKNLCQRIVERGGTPLLVGRSIDKLQKLNDEIHGKLPILSGIDFAEPEAAGKKLSAELKGEKLSGVAYCVGSITIKSLRGCKAQDFLESYNVNVLGAVETIKASLQGLKKSGEGSIVLFSSVAASNGLANREFTCPL